MRVLAVACGLRLAPRALGLRVLARAWRTHWLAALNSATTVVLPIPGMAPLLPTGQRIATAPLHLPTVPRPTPEHCPGLAVPALWHHVARLTPPNRHV